MTLFMLTSEISTHGLVDKFSCSKEPVLLKFVYGTKNLYPWIPPPRVMSSTTTCTASFNPHNHQAVHYSACCGTVCGYHHPMGMAVK